VIPRFLAVLLAATTFLLTLPAPRRSQRPARTMVRQTT
jgi:hypothetical protein